MSRAQRRLGGRVRRSWRRDGGRGHLAGAAERGNVILYDGGWPRGWSEKADGGVLQDRSLVAVAVCSCEIPRGGRWRDFPRVWERPGARVCGGPELSIPGQIPQPGWVAGSTSGSRLLSAKGGGSVRHARDGPPSVADSPEASADCCAHLRVRIFRPPTPLRPPSERLSREWQEPRKGTKPCTNI